MVHESPSCYDNKGVEMHSGASGSILWSHSGDGDDVGRGVAMDIDPRYDGYEAWASRGGLFSAAGQQISSSRPSQINFAAWWDGDLLRELLDKNRIDKWNYSSGSSSRLLSAGDYGAESNNGSKATPGLAADILGDWREEVVFRDSNNRELLIFTTPHESSYRIRTLMHDPQYRVAIAWQNVGYNQPPHPGFYLGEGMELPPLANIEVIGSKPIELNGATIEENSKGFCDISGEIESNNTGYSGTGFANTTNETGSYIEWQISVSQPGGYTLSWRNANGSDSSRPASLLIDNNQQGTVEFPSTGAWSTWVNQSSSTVSLSAGIHRVRLQATTDSGLANIDCLNTGDDKLSAASCNQSSTSIQQFFIKLQLQQLHRGSLQLQNTGR